MVDTLYHKVAREISRDIDRELYRPGERLPGVRRLARQYQVSIATALEACRHLEDAGRLEARLRSGFFVRLHRDGGAREPAMSSPPPAPSLVTGQEMVMQLVKAASASWWSAVSASARAASCWARLMPGVP